MSRGTPTSPSARSDRAPGASATPAPEPDAARPDIDGPTAHGRSRWSWGSRATTPLLRLAIIVAWLALWQLFAAHELISPVLGTYPSESWDYFVTGVQSGEILENLRATMTAVVIAWLLAGTAGVLAGVALGIMPRTERTIAPFLDALNAMPRIALAPLFIVAFGITMTAKVAVASTLVFFIALSGARAGVQSTDSEWLRLSTVLDASKFQVFRLILLPVATPSIFAAMRIGLIYGLLGVVASELIASRDGLGQLIALYSNSFQMATVYTILILLALVSSVLNQVTAVLERWMLRWRPPLDN